MEAPRGPECVSEDPRGPEIALDTPFPIPLPTSSGDVLVEALRTALCSGPTEALSE